MLNEKKNILQFLTANINKKKSKHNLSELNLIRFIPINRNNNSCLPSCALKTSKVKPFYNNEQKNEKKNW